VASEQLIRPGPDIDSFVPSENHPWWRWYCPKPDIRILFYTDDPSVRLDPNSPFGLSTLRDLISTHNTFHATFTVDLVDRHDGGHAAHKLTAGLLNGYDQVWFFGVRQCNRPAEPQNELTDPEVDALRDWMARSGRRGGVLITGDHSNPRPFDADPGLNHLLNLGRALGRRVPRAGEMRVWEGLPDASIAGSHNTQAPDNLNTNLDNLALQEDSAPQRLILKRYPLGWTWPFWVRRFRPHPLFCGRGGPIDVFPDHMHEGALALPATHAPADWPAGPYGQPVPEVVARGTDKRDGAIYDIVGVYDGEPAGVGRIVADSTWHHYFNINLRGFPAGAVRDSIADYYVNLAVWLSPAGRRWTMRCWFWWYLALHPSVRMVAGHSLAVVGRTALDVLGGRASQCVVTELIWPFPIPVDAREAYPWPPEEIVVGAVLTGYHRTFEAAVAGGGDLPDRQSLVRGGIEAAVVEHVGQLRRMASAAADLDAVVATGLTFAERDARSVPGG
jgi:hypothetical protein